MTSSQVNTNKFNFFLRAWRGEEKLWKVFWLGGLSCIILIKLCGTFLYPLLDQFRGIERPTCSYFYIGFAILYPLLITLPVLAWCVMVIRSSGNTKNNLWKYSARVSILALVVLYVFIFLFGFLPLIAGAQKEIAKLNNGGVCAEVKSTNPSELNSPTVH